MVKEVFKLSVLESGEAAEVLLYGYIGEDWMTDRAEQNRAENFAKTMRELEKRHSRINLRINSPGGSMMDGNAMISAIKAAKVPVHAYCDGVAASMAADIFMACTDRHMAKNALLMVHSPSAICMGNSATMRETADMLDKFETTAIAVMQECTGMDEKEIKKKFYDGKDHWLNHAECLALGIAQADGDEYEAAEPPAEITKKSYAEVLAFFAEQENNGQKRPLNWLEKITSAFWQSIKKTAAPDPSTDPAPTPAATDEPEEDIVHNQNLEPEMNLEDIKKSLADGTLKAEDLQALLPQKAAEPQAAPAVSREDFDALMAKVAAIEKNGATPTHGKMPANTTDPTGGEDEILKTFNEELWKDRDSRNPRFVAN